MIKIDRGPAPMYYSSTSYVHHRKLLLDYAKKWNNSNQSINMINPIIDFKLFSLEKALLKPFQNKCAYCESSILNSSELRINQFRPLFRARNINAPSVDESFYLWLGVEWENLLITCSNCERNKSNWFPVKEHRINFGTYFPDVYSESNLLIDPCHDTPSDHFYFNVNNFKIFPKTEKGEMSISILKLNTPSLVNARRNEINLFNKLLSNNPTNFLKLKRSMLKNSRDPFLAFKRELLHGWDKIPSTSRNKPMLNTIAVYKGSQTLSLKNSFINNLAILNFKGIKWLQFSLDSNAPDNMLAPWTVFIGENGMGKTSILQAIAIALSDKKYLRDLIKGTDIWNNSQRDGHIVIIFDNYELGNTIFINNKLKKITSSLTQPVTYSIGYGSTRLIESNLLKVEKHSPYTKLKNVFDHTIPIHNSERWLLSIKDQKKFNSASRIIKMALDLKNTENIVNLNNRIYLQKGKNTVLLSNLSDGYRSTIGLIVDIMATLSKKNDSFEFIEGIVLIDEIELHLHPKWKLKFVKSFRKAFPNVQVFATTHDPLCLKGLFKNEVILLKKNRLGNVYAVENLPDISGLKAEQILTSEFFGLNSTIDPDDEIIFNRYYFLLGKDKPNKAQSAELKVLKEKVEKISQLGSSLREELALHAADQVIAKEYLSGKIINRDQLKAKTIKILSDLLREKNML